VREQRNVAGGSRHRERGGAGQEIGGGRGREGEGGGSTAACGGRGEQRMGAEVACGGCAVPNRCGAEEVGRTRVPFQAEGGRATDARTTRKITYPFFKSYFHSF
jgi:hypothetical protein